MSSNFTQEFKDIFKTFHVLSDFCPDTEESIHSGNLLSFSKISKPPFTYVGMGEVY